MDKDICYKNHNKIVKIYRFLKSKNGRKIFNQKIKLLNDNKSCLLLIFKDNWNVYSKLVKVIHNICINIIEHKMVGMLTRFYIKNMCATIDKINNPIDLHKFVYLMINHPNFYETLLWFYGTLSDKTKCVELFSF